MGKSLSFAKIVATPSDTAWAQAYNAGSLFVVLALSKTADIEPESLPTIGKEILNILQSEFFVLEDKSLSSLKTAITKSLEHTPESLLISLVMAFNKDDLLYLLLVGGGTALMKRGEQTGALLSKQIDAPDRTIHAASGVLKSGDIVLIQTQEFAEAVEEPTLKEALSLELPNDIAETLSPGIHKADHAAAAALILSFHGITPPSAVEQTIGTESPDQPEQPSVPVREPQEEKDEKEVASIPESGEKTQAFSEADATEIDDDELEDEEEDVATTRRRFSLPSLSLPFSLPKRSLLLLGVVVILVILLIGSIYQTKKHQTTTKNQAEFEQVFSQAQKKYDEGAALLSLNKNLARDDFLAAQDILKGIEGKYPSGSDEQKKIADLEKKITDQVGPNSGSTTVQAKEISLSDQPLFQAEQKLTSYTAFTQDPDNLYAAGPKDISTVSPTDQKTTSIVTNNSDWDTALAIAPYNGNLYLLDSGKGILKFSKASEYQKSSYFKDSTPDLKKAVSLTIDSSIYILLSDGTILKYTKGAPDTFTVSGLTSKLISPTRILTTADFKNIYVLDPGSSRIVILDKTGAFQKDISASVLKDAKDMLIDTKEETASVLTSTKAYSLSLK